MDPEAQNKAEVHAAEKPLKAGAADEQQSFIPVKEKVIDVRPCDNPLQEGDDGYIDVFVQAPQKAWSALNMPSWCKTTKLSEDHIKACSKLVEEMKVLEAKVDAMVEESTKKEEPRPGTRGKPQVFCRVRPVSKKEKEQSEGLIEGLKTETDVAEEKDATVAAMPNAGQTLKGVLGTECNNEGTFKHTLGKHIDVMVRGGSVSVFAYGHSGTGKTHTTLGYLDEPGLFKLACAELFKVIDAHNNSEDPKVVEARKTSGKLMLQVRFSELYLGRAYDLLNKREELVLREDERGEVHLRGQTVRHADGRAETRDQKFQHIRDLDHLLEILEDGIKMRAVGSSNIHDQSSRSHAMLEMELVSEALVQAREDLVSSLGVLVPIDARRQMLEKRCASLLHYSPQRVTLKSGDHEYGEASDFTSGGDTSIYEVFTVVMMRLAHFHNHRMVSLYDEVEDFFRRHCDIPYGSQESYMNYITKNPAYKALKPHWEEMKDWWTVEGWVKGHENLGKEMVQLFNDYENALPKVLDAKKKIRDIKAALDGNIAGVLTLVDLAGADHDTRDLAQATKTELAESAQINSELATLKGVMSGLAKNTRRLPWRDQKLTMVLKRVLMPPAGGDTQPIMIACVSPSDTQTRDTLNTIHYAQMVTGVDEKAKKKGAPKKKKAPARPRNEGAINEIRAIYAEYVPEKTKEDVEKILGKFKGREQMLLAKMKAKYVNAKPASEKPAAKAAAEAKPAAAEEPKATEEDNKSQEPAKAVETKKSGGVGGAVLKLCMGEGAE